MINKYSTKVIALKETDAFAERRVFGVSLGTMRKVNDLLSGNDTYRILSLDGGGVRGIMQAVWLDELARRLGGPISNYFDLVAGTSVGSILACAVAANLDMKYVIDLFLSRSREIFPGLLGMLASKIRRIPSQGLSSPLYDGEGLETELHNAFGDAHFTTEDLKARVLITAYSTTTSAPYFLRSDQPRYSRNFVWEVCRASCAVPAYFPAYQLMVGDSLQVMVDGGVFGSNPTDSALVEALKINRLSGSQPESYLVASLGTGVSKKPIPDRVALRGGPLEWLTYIIDMLFNSIADSTNHKVLEVVGEDNLFRFQVELPRGAERLDNASQKNLLVLMRTAESYLRSQEGSKLLDRLVEKLTTPK